MERESHLRNETGDTSIMSLSLAMGCGRSRKEEESSPSNRANAASLPSPWDGAGVSLGSYSGLPCWPQDPSSYL